jgi:hypothetical protein
MIQAIGIDRSGTDITYTLRLIQVPELIDEMRIM